MTQLTFNEASDINFVGACIDNMPGKEVHTKQAASDVNFADPVVYPDANGLTCQTIGTNEIVLTLDADIITGNTFAATLKATDGTTETETAISEAFDTDHDTTMANIAAAMQANPGVDTAVVSGATNRILTLTAASGYIMQVSSEAISGGASEAGITKENNDTNGFEGFALFEQREPFQDGSNVVSRYTASEPVNVGKKVNMVCESVTGFDKTATALYAVGYGEDRGKINNVAGDNGILLPGVAFYKSATAGGKGAVSVNKP